MKNKTQLFDFTQSTSFENIIDITPPIHTLIYFMDGNSADRKAFENHLVDLDASIMQRFP
jgi:hypothetical protein